MTMQAMLMPVFAQVALTFVLLFWMSFLRIRAVRQGKVAPHAVALREPNWPPRATQISNAYHNQLETPLLFYTLILLALETRVRSTSARGLSSPMASALEARPRSASKTRLPMAARSPEPAKRCASPQSFRASAAGRLRPATSSRTSMAALARAPGVIQSTRW